MPQLSGGQVPRLRRRDQLQSVRHRQVSGCRECLDLRGLLRWQAPVQNRPDWVHLVRYGQDQRIDGQRELRHLRGGPVRRCDGERCVRAVPGRDCTAPFVDVVQTRGGMLVVADDVEFDGERRDF